jgi:uncharacterized protein YndB with AHSA1/START domain
MDDMVTGATTEVAVLVDLPVDQVWDLITDVTRIGEWSPECAFAAWRPTDGEVPHVGARFDAHNEYPDGFTADVHCVVTGAVRPSVFEWIVLDDDADPARPGSIWRYELAPGADGHGTRVLHRFTHGPGVTGVREALRDRPDRAAAALDARLGQLRRNMAATMNAMMDAKRSQR